MNTIRENNEKLTGELEIKEKQSHLFMQSLFDLKTTLKENQERQEEAEIAQGKLAMEKNTSESNHQLETFPKSDDKDNAMDTS